MFKIDKWISHLPDTDWSALKKAFNTIALILEVEFWSASIFTLSLEDGLFNSLVGQVLLESAIEDCSGFSFNLILEMNSETGV